MATLTIRNLPDEVHRALRVRAARHGRSKEAEIRAILAEAVHPPPRLPMGAALAEMARRAGVSDEDVAAVERNRDRTPATPPDFAR